MAAGALALAAPVSGDLSVPSSAHNTGRSVQDTVNALEAEGYRVILSKVGRAPLGQCTVGAVRPGHAVTEQRQDNRTNRTLQRTLYTTVYVDVIC
jgi:hypothetical protein